MGESAAHERRPGLAHPKQEARRASAWPTKAKAAAISSNTGVSRLREVQMSALTGEDGMLSAIERLSAIVRFAEHRAARPPQGMTLPVLRGAR